METTHETSNGAHAEPASKLTSFEAIQRWRASMHHAIDARAEADLLHAKALFEAYENKDFKNDTQRKASADIKAVEAERRAATAEADARADGALADLLIGRARS